MFIGITQQLNSVNMFGMGAVSNPASAASGFNHFTAAASLKSEPDVDLINNNNTTSSNLNLNPIMEEDKRPDFYDDMFS